MKTMKEYWLKERIADAIKKAREITDGKAKAKLIDAINKCVRSKSDNLYEGFMALSDAQWRIVRQFNEVDLKQIQPDELRFIVARFHKGNETERSAWRRRCKKWKLDTSPARRTSDREEYNRIRYVVTRNSTNRLGHLYQLKELVEGAMTSECSAVQAKDLLPELRAIITQAIAAKK